MIRRLSPSEVSCCGAAVIDVREFPEYVAGSIPGSKLVPAGTLESQAETWSRHEPVVLVCRSGRRASTAAAVLHKMGFSHVAVLEGGIEAWKAAGLSVQSAERKPWSLERQVRVIAGSMVLLSALLALIVSPWFLTWTVLVGAGLTFAGVSDICLMASVLGKMPWNRPCVGNECRAERCR